MVASHSDGCGLDVYGKWQCVEHCPKDAEDEADVRYYWAPTSWDRLLRDE